MHIIQCKKNAQPSMATFTNILWKSVCLSTVLLSLFISAWLVFICFLLSMFVSSCLYLFPVVFICFLLSFCYLLSSFVSSCLYFVSCCLNLFPFFFFCFLLPLFVFCCLYLFSLVFIYFLLFLFVSCCQNLFSVEINRKSCRQCQEPISSLPCQIFFEC
jgi:hypothetical protein